MFEHVTIEAFYAFLQVLMVDLVLAGDNAVVIGLAAAGLPKEQRKQAILIGIIAATVLRIGLASITVHLLSVQGLVLGGGLLLLWVCWKMWRELTLSHSEEAEALATLADAKTGESITHENVQTPPRKTFAQAAWQIVLADVSMSLDNVLAVAGAAREHPYVLVFGLVLSIALMGLAANFIASLLNKHRWIAYIGLAIILYVSLQMIYTGGMELWPYLFEAVDNTVTVP